MIEGGGMSAPPHSYSDGGGSIAPGGGGGNRSGGANIAENGIILGVYPMPFAAVSASALALKRLATLGTAELVRRFKAGDLEPAHVWTAISGARRYLDAIAAGKVRPEAEAVAFAETCRTCPSRQTRVVGGVEASYCGPPLEDNLDAVLRTCGCIVAVTVGGEYRPAGKSLVAGESCPQGRAVAPSAIRPSHA